MYDMAIRTSQGEYPVRIASGSVDAVASSADVVLVDEYVQTHILRFERDGVIAVPGSESTKTLAGCEEILTRLHSLGVRRGDHLVAIGGGAIQDAATLVSSLYMRGIPWAYAPSTAMAMADSCIGGKSSINVSGIKNLVGNIYPPVEVAIDPSLAAGLSIEAKVSGLAEAVKICFAKGVADFDRYTELAPPALEFGMDERTDALVFHVLNCKKWFIEVDEFDRKERQLLNFGHTYAHALESATSFALPHGVAVGVGVLAASLNPLGAVSESTRALQAYCRDLLSPLRDELAQAAVKVDWDAFDRAVSSDKKGTKETLRIVLPAVRGGVEITSIKRDDAALALLRESMKDALAVVAA